MYEYHWIVTCPQCGVENWALVMSVNPRKTHLTFKATNPLTGYGQMRSIHPLPMCGHSYDFEGTPVHSGPPPEMNP